MSNIITPRDTITITIDNTVQPSSIELKLSRDLPIPYVTILLSQMISKLQSDLMEKLSRPLGPAQAPPAMKQ